MKRRLFNKCIKKIFNPVNGLIIILISSLLLSACSLNLKEDDGGIPKSTPPVTSGLTEEATPAPTAKPAESATPEAPPTPIDPPATHPVRPDAESLLSSLSLEDKIGQMFFIGSRYNSTGQLQLSLDDTLSKIIERYKPGGFVFFAENLDTIDQTKAFTESLQKSSSIPMFIGIDEEGGVVTRLNKAKSLHSTVMPDPYSIGQTGKSEYAYKASQAIANEIRSLGFNLNFAPVADIYSNPINKVIGKRAYAGHAALASVMVAEAVKGSLDSRIIPVLKHFPGHGDTKQDSHSEAAVVENNLDRLRKVEFLPFKAGLQAGAEVVMTAHVLTPEITKDGLPATLSPGIIQGLLREELDFDGVVITDGLEMSAISAFYPEEEAVVLAVEAGVDILLLPRDFEKSYQAILSAVKKGRLTEARIDESVRRILKLKTDKLWEQSPNPIEPEKVLGSKEHWDLAEQIRKDITP